MPQSERREPPAVLNQLGIAAAIESLANRVERPNLEVRTRVALAPVGEPLDLRLDPEREATIYRIVEEALTRLARDGDASCLSVEVVEDEGRAEVGVTVRGLTPESGLELRQVIPSGRWHRGTSPFMFLATPYRE